MRKIIFVFLILFLITGISAEQGVVEIDLDRLILKAWDKTIQEETIETLKEIEYLAYKMAMVNRIFLDIEAGYIWYGVKIEIDKELARKSVLVVYDSLWVRLDSLVKTVRIVKEGD